MNSTRYTRLTAELQALKQCFLPDQWEPTGQYSQSTFELVNGYRVLAHAEIESFVEDIAIDAVKTKYNIWTQNREPSYIILCLVISCKFGWNDLESSELDMGIITTKSEKGSVWDYSTYAYKSYEQIINDNHGIKKKNLKRLIMPFGFSLQDLDNIWLNDMEAFGSMRGHTAHKSRRGLARTLDPRSEYERVERLLVGLKDLDEKILEAQHH